MLKMSRFPEKFHKESAMSDVTVLLVEDHPDDEFLALRALHKARINRVIVKHEGYEALDYLRSTSGGSSSKGTSPPELIIIDINMPMMNGVEMLREIRADPTLKGLPVAVLTSSANPRDVEKCMELGICAYLTKPAEPEDIAHLLSMLDSQITSDSSREHDASTGENLPLPLYI